MYRVLPIGRCRLALAANAICTWLVLTVSIHAQPGVQPTSYERTAGPARVRFDRRAPQVGDHLEQTLSLALQLDTMVRQGSEIVEQGKTALRRQQRRVVTTTHVAEGMTMAVTVRYLEASKQLAAGPTAVNLDGAVSQPQPVEGKTYRCRRDGEALLITDEQGNVPPLEEYEVVALNMESLGRPNPLAEFLAGRTLTTGERLAVPNDVAEKLLGLGGELGQVTRFELTLNDVTPIDGANCAIFRASIEATSNDSSQMRLAVDGPLTIQVDTCRAVAANLTGPIGMSETRGSLTATYQMAGTGSMTVNIASRYADGRR